MAQKTKLNALRDQLITQIHGRRLGLGPGNSSDTSPHYLMGIASIREQVDGWNSDGTTVTSTDVTTLIPPYGVTMVGATGASATTAYQLSAPVPGVRKTIFNATTGAVTVLTTAQGAFICSTGSAASTYGSFSFIGKGNYVDLIGVTTNLWGVVSGNSINTVQLTSAASTSVTFTPNVSFV